MRREKTGQGCMSLGPIAHLARGHEIAARSITAFHARLHVVDRQVLGVEDRPAVDAAKLIALKNILPRQRTLPLLAVVCSPRICTFAP